MSNQCESLREACATGNLDGVASLLREGVVDVNDRHSMNGWTALHWAAKRGHLSIVELLLKHGADASISNDKGEVPASVASEVPVLKMLGVENCSTASLVKGTTNSGDIVPNYILHPPFPYINDDRNTRSVSADYESANCKKVSTDPLDCQHQKYQSQTRTSSNNVASHLPPHLHHPACQVYAPYPGFHPRIFVLKVRLADQFDPDFIEVEFPRFEADVCVDDRTVSDDSHDAAMRPGSSTLLTFDSFVDIICDELRIPTKNLILKIRKLPDTILRKDRDVHRLQDFQEIEVVLSKKPYSSHDESTSMVRRPFDLNHNQSLTSSSISPVTPSSPPPSSSIVSTKIATILY